MSLFYTWFKWWISKQSNWKCFCFRFEFIDNKYNWSPSTTFGLTYVKKSLLVGFSVDGLLSQI